MGDVKLIAQHYPGLLADEWPGEAAVPQRLGICYCCGSVAWLMASS